MKQVYSMTLTMDQLMEFLSAMDAMVLHAGIEPALPSELDFESSASTSSANGATGVGLQNPEPNDKSLRGYTPNFIMMDEFDLMPGRCTCEACNPKVEPKETTLPPDTQTVPLQYDLMSSDKEHILDMVSELDEVDGGMGFAERLFELHGRIRLPNNWKLLFKFDDRGYFYLQVSDPSGIDNKAGLSFPWNGRKWLLSKHKTNSEIVQTAFKAVLTAVEHETREQFYYKGEAIFDPHLSVDDLVKLRKSKFQDIRR